MKTVFQVLVIMILFISFIAGVAVAVFFFPIMLLAGTAIVFGLAIFAGGTGSFE